MRPVTVMTVLVVALSTLCGCSTAYPDTFYRMQRVGDIPDLDFEKWDIASESARFLAEESGIEYYVARSGDDTLCLVLIPIDDPGGAVSSCGEHGVAVQGSSGPKVELVVPDMGERPGWRKLAPNLYAEVD